MTSGSLATGMSLVGTLRGHSSPVTCFRLIDTGQHYILISADQDGRVLGWNLDSRRQIFSLELGKEEDGQHQVDLPQSIVHYDIVVIIQMKMGRVWRFRLDMTSPSRASLTPLEPERVIRVGSGSFMQMNALGTLCLAPTIGDLTSIDLISMPDWSLIRSFKSSVRPDTCLCARLIRSSPTNSIIIVAGYDDGSISIFLDDDDKDGLNFATFRIFPESILALDCIMEEDRLKIVCGGAGKRVELIKLNTTDFPHIEEQSVLHYDLERPGVSAICVKAGLVIAGCWDTSISVFTSDTLAEVTCLVGHGDTVTQVTIEGFERGVQSSVRPSLRYKELIISSGRDGCINLWERRD